MLETDINDEDLFEEEVESEEAAMIAKLDALGMSLTRLRSEAISGRKNTGIEQEWIEDEEHYEGIDDANRSELSAWREKPLGQAPLYDDEDGDTGSNIFFNITRPYCDAGSARVADMLLPTDDRGWKIRPTPLPDLISISEGRLPTDIRSAIDGDPRFKESPELARQTEDNLIQRAKDDIKQAKEKAEKAELQIEDWHVECNYNAEMRQVIEDSSRIGTGVLKGPVPEKRKVVAYENDTLVIKEEIKPVSRRVDVWNCYPDPACGQSIHKGSYFWERDEITAKELSALRGGGYIDEQIKKCLEEGPHQATAELDSERQDILGTTKRETKNLFEVWYFYGQIKKEDLTAAGCECGDDDLYDAHLTMVNNRVIKAGLNHLDTGEFPYDFMPWQRRSQSPYGIGISRQIRDPQRVINGAARNLMDNAGLAGGPMWLFQQGLVEPIDGVYELAPRKGWQLAEDANIDDARKAFTYLSMDMMQNDLQAIIQMGLKLAEDVTGFPMLLQGQQGHAPDTLGGMQIVNNNASTVLRRIARLWDDLVTKPHVRRYYRHILQYGEDEQKGDFVIDARGSSALVERDIQNQSIAQLGNLVTSPVFGLDPKKWMSEYLKSQRLAPENFEYDDEEWKEIVQRLAESAQKPQDTSVEVAQLRAEIDKEKIASNERIKSAEMQFKSVEAERAREFDLFLTSVSNELEALNLNQADKHHAEDIKVKIAEFAAKLKVQKELSGTEALTPPVEPRGRARPGRSFQE